LISAALLLPRSVRAQEFYDHADLDFWSEAGPPKAAAPNVHSVPARKLDQREFRWEDYTDPTNDAFWDDGGDYVPPRPLRVAAANPTPENVAKYLTWQRRKLDTIAALQKQVEQQVAAEESVSPRAPEPPPAPPPQGMSEGAPVSDSTLPFDWGQVEVVFFYGSYCPHCQKSVEVVKELEHRGAKVIPVQVDWQQRPPLLPGSAKYTADIAKAQPVQAVPTWIASYGLNQITLQGEVTVESMEKWLKEEEAKQQLTRRKEGTE
jgi:hypothetical protein